MASNHGTRILIKYAVFPDLDTVSTSWQFGHLNSSGRIKWDDTDDIILIAKSIVHMLKLGNVQNVSPDTVWHRTVESTTTVNSNTITTKIHERPADNKAPEPFDPRTDVLVFVPEALKDRITSVPLITVYPNITTRQPRRRLVPNIQIKYFISPHMSHQFQTCIRGLPNRDAVVSWDGLLSIRDVNIIAATISSDHNLGNVIVRGVPIRSRQNSSFEPTDLFQPDKSGHTAPFSLWTHDLVLYPVDGNVGVSQETEERWKQLFSRGGRLLATCCSVEGMKEFNTLMYETKNVYGIQHERIYETVVGIASILYHEKCFLASARIILDYFTEPQVASASSATVDNAVDVVRKLSSSWTQQNNPGVVHLPITQASLRLAQDFCIASIRHKNLQLAARMARSNGQVLTLAKKYKEADGIYRSYFSNLTKMTLDYSLYHVFALKAFAANLHYQENYSEAAHRYQDVFSKRALFPVVEYFKTNLINSLILNMDYETCLPYVIEHCHNQCATCVKEGCVGGVCSERMKNWGTCYFHVGNIEEALPIFQKHQTICERLYGKDSLKTFETMRMIGRCLESKDPISSHQLYDKVEARYSTEPGKNNSNIQLIEWSRGSLWFQTGEFEKAEEIWIKVLAERRQYNEFAFVGVDSQPCPAL
ncbi:hypothetical protein BDR26DRAFT_897731 [Obelidium mucronatum]|nr:hypothetical protein BDR26DRAFT_897731 [Obelidium mucronatum]